MVDNAQQEPETEFDWSEMIRHFWFRSILVFRRLWWVFLITISAGVGYQYIVVSNQKPVYQSYARMIVDGQVALGGASNIRYQETYTNFYGTQIDLMTSELIKRRAADRVAVRSPELKPCYVSISVFQSANANIFNLQSSGANRGYVKAFLDAVMEEYLNFKRERRSQSTENTFLSAMEKVLEYRQQIEELEQAKLEFQKANNLIFVREQGNHAGTYLAELNTRLAGIRTELKLLEQLNLEKYSADAASLDSAMLESALDNADAEYILAKRVVDKLRAERDEFGIYMRPKHPKMIELNRQIERQDNLLKIFRRQTVSQLLDRKRILQAELDNLMEVISDWETKALKYSSLLAEFERLNSRLDSIKKLETGLSSSMESLDVNRNIDQDTVTILQQASNPQEPTQNKRKAILSGLALGIGGGIAILFIAAVLDNRMVSVDDVTKRFDQPILGILPLQKGASGTVDLLDSKDDRFMFAESCRNIRSSLLFMDSQGPPPQCILITSSIPAEGKSTLAANLSITLAFASSRTLLIDCDLRRGHLHKEFSLSNERGVAELVEDDLSVDEVIQQTKVEGLDFIPCGMYPGRPGELLMSTKFESVVAELRTRYDYIIFDCPPVLATDDTPSFATRSDALLFLIRSNYTHYRQVKASMDILELRGTQARGLILNFVDRHEPNHYYYKYYDYYSAAPDGGKKDKKKSRDKVSKA